MPVLVWIGLRSYGIYLWHFPIFAVTRLTDLDGAFGFTPPGWLWFTIRLALTLGVAELSYKYVEVPIRSGAIRRYMERVRAARGPGRRQLATRGVAVAAILSLLAIALGTGLAERGTGQGEDPRHHRTRRPRRSGIRTRARSEALDELQRDVVVDRPPPTPPTTVGPGRARPPTPAPTAPTAAGDTRKVCSASATR